jgi:undecaprenyl-diphosphatase
MELGYSLLKGFIQGLTEFLPVSSTAHLTFANALFDRFGWQPPLRPGEDEFFDIMLHIGTLVAVVFYFRTDLWLLLQVTLGKAPKDSVDPPSGLLLRKLPMFLALSSVTTIAFVLALKKISGAVMEKTGWATATVQDLSDYYFAHPQWVAIHLMLVGILLFTTERLSKRSTSGGEFGPFNAIVIGLVQGCAAIFHGISRSGSTISAGLATGLDRMTATRYTFMLSIPTFILAAAYEAVKLHNAIPSLNWPIMLAGVAVSAISGYLCVKYLIRYVASHSLNGFALYCLLMGAIMFFLFMGMPPVKVAG